MNIPEIIDVELAGFCDLETGECVVIESDTSPSAQTEDRSHEPDTPEATSPGGRPRPAPEA